MAEGRQIAIVRAGMTQRELSLASAVSESRLSLILHGFRDPTDRERAALSRVLRCDPSIFDDFGVADRRAAVLERGEVDRSVADVAV